MIPPKIVAVASALASALALALAMLVPTTAMAKVVEYDLTIAAENFEVAGGSRPALTVNGGIPGPVLRFREGDTALIRVHNALAHDDTSVHWHGLLVPNAMDGVPFLTTPPIPAGQSFTYEFPLRHSGTYWYHSHTGLQEQQGVYGAIVVEPITGERVHVDREHVVVLSDWTNERPEEVMRTLMRGSEWYGIKKGNAQSILGAVRAGRLRDYLAREKSRMAPMDVSDVAYDAFLINGRSRENLPSKPGERIRLRVINAASSSYFYVHSATGPLTVLAADGPAVEPVQLDRILIGMAETYDLMVTVPAAGAWEFRATAQDNSGHASLFMGDAHGVEHMARPLPAPDLYAMDEMLIGALDDDETTLAELRSKARPSAPYEFLRSLTATTLRGPQREIPLRLTGDMTRYVWSFNGKTLSEQSTIPVTKGEVLRIELINDTMMHHPLHLHGHFFRVLNRNGTHSPLKHTVDVPPMGRRTIEFLADEEGDWFFHCHLLYHMDAGMARVFSYAAADDASYEPTLDPGMIGKTWFMTEGMVLNHMTMGMATLMRERENLSFMWDYGYDEHHPENEFDFYWSHYFDPNLTSSLGYRITDSMDAEDRMFGSISYRLPFMVQSELSLDSEGDVRVGMGRELQLTPRWSITGDAEYDTNTEWKFQAGSSWLLNKQLSITTFWNSEHGLGAGLSFRF